MPSWTHRGTRVQFPPPPLKLICEISQVSFFHVLVPLALLCDCGQAGVSLRAERIVLPNLVGQADTDTT